QSHIYDAEGSYAVTIRSIDAGPARVNVGPNGDQANSGNYAASSISPDGRYVAFASAATNLLPPGEDTNHSAAVFVPDPLDGTTTRVSVASNGAEGLGDSWNPKISADGRFVFFSSSAAELVEGDTNGWYDIFMYDRDLRQTTLISLDSSGNQANGNSLVKD